jgi:hypothetical protein
VADDKGETMTIKINETDLLDLLGENGERWVQGEWGDGDAMCLHGAIRHCSPLPGDAYLIEQVAERQGWGTSWNDSDGTNWQMIRQRLARIEVTDADLADRFGPQWDHIVALVRRAAVLTADEATRLDAARDAARDAAWDAAGYAARDAAREAAREAARYAAGYAAWDAAREAARYADREAARYAAWDAAGYAAWEAARALAMRDLIGQRAFTQEHYDLLTGPWATVIGPVHSDDEARRG